MRDEMCFGISRMAIWRYNWHSRPNEFDFPTDASCAYFIQSGCKHLFPSNVQQDGQPGYCYLEWVIEPAM